MFLTLCYDDRCTECLDVEMLLHLLDVPFTCLPCKGLSEAILAIGVQNFEGMKQIRRIINEGILHKLMNPEPAAVKGAC